MLTARLRSLAQAALLISALHTPPLVQAALYFDFDDDGGGVVSR